MVSKEYKGFAKVVKMPEMLLCETMSLGKMLLVLGNHVIKVILVGKVKMWQK